MDTVKHLVTITLVSWLTALALLVTGAGGYFTRAGWTRATYVFPLWWCLFSAAAVMPVLLVVLGMARQYVSHRLYIWRENRRLSRRWPPA